MVFRVKSLGFKRALLGALLFCLPTQAGASPYNAADEAFCAPYQNVAVHVSTVFENPTVDQSLSLRELQQTSRDVTRSIPQGESVLLGVVHYAPTIAFNTTIKKKPLADGTFCERVEKLNVTMGYREVAIKIANEFTADGCSFNHVLAHEQKHVRVNAELLQEFAPKIQARLAGILHDNGVYRVATEDQAESMVRARMNYELEALAKELTLENQRRQALVDSPQEYATNNTACGGRVQDITRRALGRVVN